jgi:hypothetical protein
MIANTKLPSTQDFGEICSVSQLYQRAQNVFKSWVIFYAASTMRFLICLAFQHRWGPAFGHRKNEDFGNAVWHWVSSGKCLRCARSACSQIERNCFELVPERQWRRLSRGEQRNHPLSSVETLLRPSKLNCCV